jgi:plasmid replication initiation protein
MAMALVPSNASAMNDYCVKFSVGDFLKALGMERTGEKTNKLVFNAVNECIESSIKIWAEDKSEWVAWTWFGMCSLKRSAENWETITMHFSPLLGAELNRLKKAYSAIRLENLGRLQSKYAIRYYEIAQSFAGFAGKDGNPKDTWYFDYSVMELKTIFGLSKSKYREANNFRVKVVDQPIAEVNAAGIGLHITVEYVRNGRKLAGFRFVCRRIGDGDAQPTDTAERLREKHPERFNELLAEVEQFQRLRELHFPVAPSMRRIMAEAEAEERLRAEMATKRGGRSRKAASVSKKPDKS